MKQFTMWKYLRSASSKACYFLNHLVINVSKIPVRFESNLSLKYKYYFKCTFWKYITLRNIRIKFSFVNISKNWVIFVILKQIHIVYGNELKSSVMCKNHIFYIL